YRDFGDKPQYELFDFHEEKELPKLLAALEKIEADGGGDTAEDIAGGLKLATELKWKSNIRLCILLADAPCHGTVYHTGEWDDHPRGCPKGKDPVTLLYKLQYEIGADFYFIRITEKTDKMIRVLQKKARAMWDLNATTHRLARNGGRAATKRDIVVHDLGSEDNRFLEVVVESVKVSVQQYLFENL
ncbi:unnamed protein product, partial [Ectocarpus fasciculatus]